VWLHDPHLTSPDNWPWQSNGNCTNHCKEEGTYAFAVLQYTDCWCSNYAPGDTANMNDCEVDCPGFPDEKCGNKDKDLFMYIEMDGQVSGTIGGSQPTSSADAPSSTQEAPKTVSTSLPILRALLLSSFCKSLGVL
jgi:cell wall integrity and stress response component